MKVLTTLMLSTALVTSTAALADDYRGKSHRGDYKTHEYKRYHGDDQRYYRKQDRKHDKHKQHEHFAGAHGVLRLDIPVRVRGDERIKLRQLVRNRYGIDTKHYRLRAVVVNNRARHNGFARLRTGDEVSRKTYLERGENRIRAPRSGQHGKWVLRVDNARINNIRVILEPRRQQFADRYDHHDRYDRYGRYDRRDHNDRYRWYFDRWSRLLNW